MFIFLKPDLNMNTPRSFPLKSETCSLLPHFKGFHHCLIHIFLTKSECTRILVNTVCQMLHLPP